LEDGPLSKLRRDGSAECEILYELRLPTPESRAGQRPRQLALAIFHDIHHVRAQSKLDRPGRPAPVPIPRTGRASNAARPPAAAPDVPVFAGWPDFAADAEPMKSGASESEPSVEELAAAEDLAPIPLGASSDEQPAAESVVHEDPISEENMLLTPTPEPSETASAPIEPPAAEAGPGPIAARASDVFNERWAWSTNCAR